MRYDVKYAFRANTVQKPQDETGITVLFWLCFVAFVCLIVAAVAANVVAFLLLPFRL